MKRKLEAVLVTGASSGIGKEIVRVLIRDKIHVVACSRRLTKLKSVVPNSDENSGYFHPYKINIANSKELKKTFSEISKKFVIYGLVNNAGITAFKTAVEHTEKEIEEIIKVNLLGAIHLTKFVLPGMIRRNNGIILNILSVAAKDIFANSSVYSASKAGLLAYMNVLREELKGSKIKIVNILPGATATPIWPEKALSNFADKMMTAKDVANFAYMIFNLNSTVIPEEITIRPIHGDL